MRQCDITTNMDFRKVPLEILVVDDSFDYLDAAKLQLREHNIDVASTFYDAAAALEQKKYQVLLSDMNFPLGEGHTRDIHTARPLGYALALLAARPKHSVPLIGLLTDSNHHSDAIAATFDYFRGGIDCTGSTLGSKMAERSFTKLNSSYFVTFDSYDNRLIGMEKDKAGHEFDFGMAEKFPPGIVPVKNWKRALDALVELSYTK